MAGKQILLFPFMAQGHLIPFLSLANLISDRHRSYGVTLVNTPLNVKKLRSSLPPNSPVELETLPFSSSDHGLPPDTESTESLPLHLFTDFFAATETLKPSFERLVSEKIRVHGYRNVCVVADMFLGWTVESADKLGVFHTVFVASGAYGTAMFCSLWLHPPANFWSSEEEEFAMVDFPEIRIRRSVLFSTIIPTDGTDPLTTFMRRQLNLCFRSNGLLVNTVEEFEEEGLSLLRRSPGLHVWSIGPLVRLSSPATNHSAIQWLNSKPPASVLYISFGSQNSIPSSQMMQLAKGLEASGKRFIWVIRPPLEFGMNEEFRVEWLPEGFEERMRMKDQGMVVHKWAPQQEILAHGATAVFLSHCGWNSVMESLCHGVPVIGWPLIGDQMYNLKVLEEMGVGLMGMQDIEEAIELVMGGTKKGNEMIMKALQMKHVLRRALREGEGSVGSSTKAMKDFLHTAFSHVCFGTEQIGTELCRANSGPSDRVMAERGMSDP